MTTLILLATLVSASNTEKNRSDDTTNEIKVKATIQALFDAMRAADSTRLRPLFTENAQLKTLVSTKSQGITVREESVESLIRAVGTPHKEVWDERIFDIEVRIDGELAMVWTKYEFFVDTEFRHCGVNLFQLLKENDRWKIFSITDTRRKSPCQRQADTQK